MPISAKDKAWLERQRSLDPGKGYVYGRDDPGQAFHARAYTYRKTARGAKLERDAAFPKALDYMALWRAWLELVPRNDPNDGLSASEIDVLMNSDDDKRKVSVTIFGAEYRYNAQRTKKTAVAKKLQNIGLVYILEYLGGNLIGSDGLPLGLKGCVFAYTPFGIKWVQLRLGKAQNQEGALYLHPSVADVNRYG